MLRHIAAKALEQVSTYVTAADIFVLRRKIDAQGLQISIKESEVKFLERRNEELMQEVSKLRAELAQKHLDISLLKQRIENDE